MVENEASNSMSVGGSGGGGRTLVSSSDSESISITLVPDAMSAESTTLGIAFVTGESAR